MLHRMIALPGSLRPAALLLLCATVPWPGVAAECSVSVQHLTCEYRTNPLGLDVRQPRFSWKLQPTQPAARGQAQTAYRILVATSRARLAHDQGDLWDSGWTRSDQSQLVVYNGHPLPSGESCFWKVRVKDETGTLSEWSAPAFWTVGVLSPDDWTSEWIGTDMQFHHPAGSPPDNTMPDPWLRKTITLAARPLRAFMYVASIGYHELYINGRKVGDAVLMPCVSDHNKRARYVTYEITPYLRRGRNTLGLWLGTAWSIYPQYHPAGAPRSPIVRAQADLELPGGKRERLVTDGSWKWHASPNTTIGTWNFTNFGGERYDASREIPDWCGPTLDDSRWKPVSVFPVHLILSAQTVQPNRLEQEIKPVAMTEPAPGVYRFDMGVNFAGWLQVKLRGRPGDRIEIKLSERKDQAMTHRLHDFYIIGPAGQGTFRNHFNYGVGRWIQIEGLRHRPSLHDLRGWLVRTDYRRTTHFACSNPLLNDIYQATVWTWQNLSLGGYSVDCPQRERMGYGGDAHATTETALDNFSLGAFYTKWSQDWRDVQGTGAAWGTGQNSQGKPLENGNLPYTAPTIWGGGGPAWSGYCVTLPWLMYRHFGDTRILAQNFDTIRRWLDFLETKARDNLLRRWGGEWDFLGDWLWPGAKGVNGDTRETLFFNNCYWIDNLETAARIADALDKGDAAAHWRARANQVKAAVQREFYRGDGSYVNDFQAYLSIALFVGLPPADQRGLVERRLVDRINNVRKGHFWGGITGGYFIIQNLLAMERPDLMYEMVSRDDYPSWGYMLRHGATTLWEDWEGNLSLCHSSYLHVGAWFIEGLAGIRPGDDGHGYKHFIIRPGIWPASPVNWVKCSLDSPYGLIESNWRREGGKLRFKLVVPPNTTGTVYFPADEIAAVSQDGKPLGAAAEARLVRGPARSTVAVRLPAGRYTFEAR
jgi:alpha-L-rhamnosidase